MFAFTVHGETLAAFGSFRSGLPSGSADAAKTTGVSRLGSIVKPTTEAMRRNQGRLPRVALPVPGEPGASWDMTSLLAAAAPPEQPHAVEGREEEVERTAKWAGSYVDGSAIWLDTWSLVIAPVHTRTFAKSPGR
ncbi:hypothetical protein SGFS_041550 [Streptomyces graminofaciens]|uniref:Uncharacterized protein n=1 Tax=Streptomyces graminofaciens TaxID=68212 RepID=A0ABM7FA22_9ACTN|nr:hypothetical protein SGFS_041550 [Streptomyces graminofaciens]